MAGIIVLPEKKRKAERPYLTAADLERYVFLRNKLPAWLADKLNKFEDLNQYGPECINLIRKAMAAEGVHAKNLCARIGAHPTYATRLFGSKYHIDQASPKTATIIAMLEVLEPEFKAAKARGPRPKPVIGVKTYGGAADERTQQTQSIAAVNHIPPTAGFGAAQ